MIISHVLLGLSFYINNRTRILIIVISSNILAVIGFFFIPTVALAGALIVSVAIVRDITTYLLNRKKTGKRTKISKLDSFLLVLWLSLLAATIPFSFTGDVLSLFAFLGATFITIGLWQTKFLGWKILGGVAGNGFWVVYNFYAGNFFGGVLRAVLIAMTLAAIWTYLRIQKHKMRRALAAGETIAPQGIDPNTGDISPYVEIF